MKNKIKEHINNPRNLETLYQEDQKGFEKAFFEIYPEIANLEISEFWKTRLEFDNPKEGVVKINKNEILLLIIACALTAFLIEIPQWFNINSKDAFFSRNLGLIVLFGLAFYTFISRESIKTKPLLITIGTFLISALYINLIPYDPKSDSMVLAYFHLPLLLWCIYGLIFIDFDTNNSSKRVDYLKYNGDLAILMALILIVGGILSGVTIELFAAIDIKIEKFFSEYIAFSGLVSVPIIATFIIRKFPFVANKIAPIIANIFSPLVLITLVIYLISILISGKDPYNDRDFLLVFNIMLLGVMAIIMFSVSETSFQDKRKFNNLVIFALSIVTIIIDLIALSAILFRISEFGFTPNRVAVLGSNVLILGNLLLIMIDLYKANFRNKGANLVEVTIAKYLPIYMLWTIAMVFIIPVLFGFK